MRSSRVRHLLCVGFVLALGLVLSLAIGISLGMLGGGGSILTVPVVHYVLGVEAHAAISTSLLVVGATSAVALVPHARARRVRWGLGVAFGASSMGTAFLGSRIGATLPAGALLASFAGLMVIAGVAMVMRAGKASLENGVVRPARIVVIGLFVGLITGTLGAGGGFVIVPALTLVAGLSMRDAVGTSLFVIALNSAAGIAGSIGHTHVDLRIAGAVASVAIVGSLVGARLVHRVSAQALQKAFGWFVIAVAVFIAVEQLV